MHTKYSPHSTYKGVVVLHSTYLSITFFSTFNPVLLLFLFCFILSSVLKQGVAMQPLASLELWRPGWPLFCGSHARNKGLNHHTSSNLRLSFSAFFFLFLKKTSFYIPTMVLPPNSSSPPIPWPPSQPTTTHSSKKVIMLPIGNQQSMAHQIKARGSPSHLH